MALGSIQISLLISATLLGLLPVSQATAQSLRQIQPILPQNELEPVQSGSPLEPIQSGPSYVGDPPPPVNQLLPPERLRQDVEPLPKDFRVSALQPDFTGDLWVGSWLGLARINPNTGRLLARISLPNYTIGALAQDRVGRIWAGSYEGLLRIDPRSNEVTAQNFTLPSNRILSLLIDRRVYLWV